MVVSLIPRSRIELSIVIPQGLESSVSILLQDSEPVTVFASQYVPLRDAGVNVSFAEKTLTCMAASSDLIGLGNGNTIAFDLFENGIAIAHAGILVPSGTPVSLQPVTFFLKEE